MEMYVKVHLVTRLSGSGCQFESCQQTHGAALSVYTRPEPEDHGVQSADVTLICGVTDCWRRGHLL